MKTYDKSRFRQIMVCVDAYSALKNAKQSLTESFTDVIRRLIKFASGRDIEWAIVRPVQSSVKEFYGSELFA